MADVNLANSSVKHFPSRWANVKTFTLVEAVLDLAEAVTTKGSALASGDVLKIMNVPAESMVFMAGFEVLEAMGGTSTDATVNVSVGSTTFVSGFDLDAASVGDYATVADVAPAVVTAADTLDVVLGTFTGTITSGKLRVFMLLIDVSDRSNPGISKPGS